MWPAHCCAGLLRILRMPNDCWRAFWFDSSFDRPKRPQIRVQVHPRCNGRWCASGFTHRGSSLQWHLAPRPACHICERKWPISWWLAAKDNYGSSGANVQPDSYLARQALGPAIIRESGAIAVEYRDSRCGRKPSSEIDDATGLSVSTDAVHPCLG